MSATTSGHNVEQAVPFYWVADIRASVRFYVDGLGFTVTADWVARGSLRWCWLQLGGAAVMLQEVPKEARGGASPSASTRPRAAGDFICKDALAIYREVSSRRGPVKQPVVGNRKWCAVERGRDRNG